MITRSYLESWANGRDLVYVVDTEAKVHGVRSLGGATVVRYVYQTEHANVDLETEYCQIEGDGIAAIRTLARSGVLQSDGQRALVAFLDMFLERGRFADQAKVKMPVAVANLFRVGVRDSTMGLGDRLVFSRDIDKDAIRLSSLKIERWPWRVIPVESGLITGDGAVLLWKGSGSDPVAAVTFPLSRTRLLVIGDVLLGRQIPINPLILRESKRWLVDHVDGVLVPV